MTNGGIRTVNLLQLTTHFNYLDNSDPSNIYIYIFLHLNKHMFMYKPSPISTLILNCVIFLIFKFTHAIFPFEKIIIPHYM